MFLFMSRIQASCQEQIEIEFGGLDWEWHPIQANEKYLKWIEANVVVRPHVRASALPGVGESHGKPRKTMENQILHWLDYSETACSFELGRSRPLGSNEKPSNGTHLQSDEREKQLLQSMCMFSHKRNCPPSLFNRLFTQRCEGNEHTTYVLCTYLQLHICTYTCMCECIFMYIFIFAILKIHQKTHTNTQICLYIYMYVQIDTYLYIYL